MAAVRWSPAVRAAHVRFSCGLGGFTLSSRHGGHVAWKAVPDPKRSLRPASPGWRPPHPRLRRPGSSPPGPPSTRRPHDGPAAAPDRRRAFATMTRCVRPAGRTRHPRMSSRRSAGAAIDRGWSPDASGSAKQQGAVAGAERELGAKSPGLARGARPPPAPPASNGLGLRMLTGLRCAARRIGRAGLAARGADLPHAPARCLSRKRAEALCGGPARNRLGRSVATW